VVKIGFYAFEEDFNGISTDREGFVVERLMDIPNKL